MSLFKQQRITIIQSLLLGRKYLFLDEVTSALDETNINKVIDTVCDDPSITLLVVSHNQQWRAKVDMVYCVENKKLTREPKMEYEIE